MSPAVRPRPRAVQRLLAVDPQAGTLADRSFADLPSLLAPGDLLVMNDAATLPASLRGRTASGAPIELRLVEQGAGAGEDATWLAVLFGAGDARTKTEDRPAPPPVLAGDALLFGDASLVARVALVDEASPRLVRVAFEQRGASLWSALYRFGRPIQYAYVEVPLELWDVQTVYAARPWAAELPSAGRPLTFAVLADLTRRGVALATLTHGAGLSSTGDAALDRRLPLPERYDLPSATTKAIAEARARGGRVVAVGTTVVRALEGAALAQRIPAGGELAPGEGRTAVLLGPGFRRRVVDGILSGVHEATESHFALLASFAPRPLLLSALAVAERAGYLGHELGDSMVVLPRPLPAAT